MVRFDLKKRKIKNLSIPLKTENIWYQIILVNFELKIKIS